MIGDLDQDGFPEVVIGWTILDGKTGAVKKELDPASTWGAKLVGLSDLDGDGKLDITDGQRAYRADGSVLWDLRSGADKVPVGYHAVGDFDKDGKPEVAAGHRGRAVVRRLEPERGHVRGRVGIHELQSGKCQAPK